MEREREEIRCVVMKQGTRCGRNGLLRTALVLSIHLAGAFLGVTDVHRPVLHLPLCGFVLLTALLKGERLDRFTTRLPTQVASNLVPRIMPNMNHGPAVLYSLSVPNL